MGLLGPQLGSSNQGSLDLELPAEFTANKTVSFEPQSFLVPGWNGEGLLSRPGFSIKKAHKALIADAKNQFKEIINRNISHQKIVFNEFLSYLEFEDIHNNKLDNSVKFSNYISKSKEYESEIENFIDLYCFRSVTVYLYKAKFLLSLASKLEISIEKIDLHNPNSVLSRIFKKGSSTELNCESFKIHQYSWYRPSIYTAESVTDIKRNLAKISTTEMMKLATYDLSGLEYSHSYSHKSFGLFVNCLLTRLPVWLENDGEEQESPFENLFKSRPKEKLSTLTTKFAGNNLSSLSLSHWMAQENNVIEDWQKVICPEFSGSEFFNGKYTKICQEIQFLTFLIELSTFQGHDVLPLICSMMNDKNLKSSANEAGQMSIFSNNEIKESTQNFDRIVLNLTTLPKKNPHHYLMSQISSQLKELDKTGYLYVFTNQKFFVPSHSDKIEHFLKDTKIEALFNFDQLTGRGEIASYLYIFKKRKNFAKPAFLTPIASSDKESCLSFRWNGNLEIFNKFHSFVGELHKFMDQKSPSSTPIYQGEPAEGVTFDFHQDAILDGLLLSSTSNDSSNITHPNFFKNLTTSCTPFDSFFQIETLSSEYNSGRKNRVTSELLGITVRNEERFPLLLIVNYTNPKNIILELTSSDVYQAKLEQYGMAYFQYFGLIPKRNDINLNVFREYFNTQLGKQIIQLFLNGGYTKIKSKLRSLLIPKFFLQNQLIPEHLLESFSIFNLTSSEILNSHPETLKESYEQSAMFLDSVSSKYSWHTMSMLSHFKTGLNNSLEKLDQTPAEIFKNPVIVEQLIKSSSYSIYPKNEDIFVRIPLKDPSDIHLPLTNIEVGLESENDNHYVQLISGDKVIVQLYTSDLLSQFMKFILSSAIDMPVSAILQNLKVPASAELESILINHTSLRDSIGHLEKVCNSRILSILTNNINS